MSTTNLQKSSIVLVVSEFPPGADSSNCKRNIQRRLWDGTLFSVHLRGKINDIWFPESKYGPYCKIKGKIKDLHLCTLIKFLKSYGECKEMANSELGFFNFPKKLGEGVACEDIGALMEFLTNALAFERWKVYYETEYSPLNERNYCEAMCRYEEVRGEVRRSLT